MIFFNLSIFSYGEKLVSIYETNNRKVIVFKTKFILTDELGNLIDSYYTEPWEIKDCCIGPQKEYLFMILGKTGALRGERLAIFSRTLTKIKKVWIDENRGHNPWKIIVKDIDGDSKLEVCVGVWKKTRFHPVFDNRLFIYNWDRNQIFPKWLGSRLSSPFIDFDFQDIDNDGVEELLSLEMQRDGLKRIMSYKWKGFGFEGLEVLRKDLKEESLCNFKREKEEK